MKSSLVLFLLIASFFLAICSLGFAQQQAQPDFKLFLIGDAGDDDTTGATLLDLKKKLHENPNSAVIFLGDNCYSKPLLGLSNAQIGGFDGGEVGKRRIMSQLNILNGYHGSAFLIPGNHDWWNLLNLKKGKKRLSEEAVFVEDTLRKLGTVLNSGENTFLPTHGSPGPVYRELNEGKIRIVFIDTYRLIIEEANDEDKDTVLLNTFYKELNDQLADALKKHQKIIVAGHHPIHAKGKHSQPPSFFEKMMRRFADSNTNYPPYNRIASRLDSLMKAQHRPGIYYVSGHEHSLEYFYNDSLHYIVSGAGSKIDKVTDESCMDETECVQWNEAGYFEIGFYGKSESVLMHHRKNDDSPMEVICLSGCN